MTTMAGALREASWSMTPQKILVPIDFSQGSEQALDYACALAKKIGATVHLVHGLDAALPELTLTLSSEMLRSLRDGNQAALDRLADARRANVEIGMTLVMEGDPREVIHAAAEKLGVDLIVMGTHGRRGLARLFLGSVAEDVSRRAPCPVLLVRGSKRGAS